MDREAGITAHDAAAKARTWRESFAKQAAEMKAKGEARLQEAGNALELAWGNYETEMAKWADSSRHTGEAYSARAGALLSAWQESAAHYKTAAVNLAEAESRRVVAAVSQLEREAAQFRDTCTRLQKAGGASWTAVGMAAARSRARRSRPPPNRCAPISRAPSIKVLKKGRATPFAPLRDKGREGA